MKLSILVAAASRYEWCFVVVNPEVNSQPHLVDSDADDILRKADGKLVLRRFSTSRSDTTLFRLTALLVKPKCHDGHVLKIIELRQHDPADSKHVLSGFLRLAPAAQAAHCCS